MSSATIYVPPIPPLQLHYPGIILRCLSSISSLPLRLTNKALFRIFFPLLFTSGCSPTPPSPLRMSQKSISTHPHILHPHPSPAVNNSSFAKNPIEHQPTIIIHLHLHCNPHRHVTTTFAVRHHHHHDPGIYTHKYSLPPVLRWRNFIKYCSFCSSAADFTILQKFAAKKLDINLLCQPVTSARQPEEDPTHVL